ncbi:hypothetical protein V8E53_006120 [Lactarius tabidus]
MIHAVVFAGIAMIVLSHLTQPPMSLSSPPTSVKHRGRSFFFHPHHFGTPQGSNCLPFFIKLQCNQQYQAHAYASPHVCANVLIRMSQVLAKIPVLPCSDALRRTPFEEEVQDPGGS